MSAGGVADPAAVAAARAIATRAGATAPALALVLGSGLGGLTAEIEERTVIPYDEVPGLPHASVKGHAGVAVLGTLDGVRVLAFSGRFHLYEGHPPATAALLPRVAHALGARALFVSNAAGGIAPALQPGHLMLIRDHINLMFRNPLTGPRLATDERFPDMSDPYDDGLRATMRDAARALETPLTEGVYAGLLGPSYETPAEIRMLARLGADAVGMSTVPEVIAARAMGMRVVGISCITNAAAGLGAEPLDHTDVLAVTNQGAERFRRLLRAFVHRAFAPPS